MRKDLLSLKREISLLPIKDNLICFLVYGSILTNKNINDFDAVIIVKKVDSTLNDLFKILSHRYKKLDINVYSREEILKGLSFYTREFKLEYLSRGLCIYGKNILKDEYAKINEYEYKQSMLIRSIERLQMVRQKYFTSTISSQKKLRYMKKYFLRISKSILILSGKEKDISLEGLTQNEVNKKLLSYGIVDINQKDFGKIKTLNEYFGLFNVVSKILIEYKGEFGQKDKNNF